MLTIVDITLRVMKKPSRLPRLVAFSGSMKSRFSTWSVMSTIVDITLRVMKEPSRPQRQLAFSGNVKSRFIMRSVMSTMQTSRSA
jgi:hypothetical protein